MKIKKFSATGLHGYLKFTLNFNPDLTFLTGINGSGKTSAVRAITALLTPALPSLAEMEYETIEVLIEHEGSEIGISSSRNEDELWLVCDGFESSPLRLPILKPEVYEGPKHFQERRYEFYREQEALNGKHPVLDLIRHLPTPMFLDLERRYQEGVRMRRAGGPIPRRIATPANPLAGTLAESLLSAQELAEDAYRTFLASRSTATDKLKQDLILSPFRDGESESQLNLWERSSEFVKQLKRTEGVVIQSLQQIGIPPDDIEQTVHPFFKYVRDTSTKLPDVLSPEKPLDDEHFEVVRQWSALAPRVEQINLMAARISQYNRLITAAYARVEKYLHSVNGFLSDSSKEISLIRGVISTYPWLEGEKRER